MTAKHKRTVAARLVKNAETTLAKAEKDNLDNAKDQVEAMAGALVEAEKEVEDAAKKLAKVREEDAKAGNLSADEKQAKAQELAQAESDNQAAVKKRDDVKTSAEAAAAKLVEAEKRIKVDALRMDLHRVMGIVLLVIAVMLIYPVIKQPPEYLKIFEITFDVSTISNNKTLRLLIIMGSAGMFGGIINYFYSRMATTAPEPKEFFPSVFIGIGASLLLPFLFSLVAKNPLANIAHAIDYVTIISWGVLAGISGEALITMTVSKFGDTFQSK
ncbi:YEATS-associated helix-containing protein [Methylomonas sp. MgM2]